MEKILIGDVMKDWIRLQFSPAGSEKSMVDLIRKLSKTHDVIFIDRGTLCIKKK